MAGISIVINAGTSKNTSSVQASGYVQNVITDAQAKSFGVQDDAIKNAVNTYFGKQPNDAYLHSDTPWNDLYKTYNWPQVTTTLSIVSATITGITADPQVIATTQFDNAGNPNEATYNASITQQLENSVESNWSMTETVSVSQEISYGVSFLGEGVSGSTTLSYSQGFGQGGSKTETVTVGASSGVTVVLQPGQVLNGQLTATKGTMNIRIVYQASLSGDVAINYNPTYKGHHFFALPIASVMQAAHINNSLQITEDITVGFYTNAVVKVSDPSGKPVHSVAAKAAQAPMAHLVNTKVLVSR